MKSTRSPPRLQARWKNRARPRRRLRATCSKRLSAPVKSRPTLPAFNKPPAIPAPQPIRFSRRPASCPDSQRRCEVRSNPSSAISKPLDRIPLEPSPPFIHARRRKAGLGHYLLTQITRHDGRLRIRRFVQGSLALKAFQLP